MRYGLKIFPITLVLHTLTNISVNEMVRWVVVMRVRRRVGPEVGRRGGVPGASCGPGAAAAGRGALLAAQRYGAVAVVAQFYMKRHKSSWVVQHSNLN